MNLNLTNARFNVTGASDAIFNEVQSALSAHGYSWEPRGNRSAIASKAGHDRCRPRPKGSAKTQIEVQLDGSTLTTRRISRGNHKGFVGVIQVQQDHRDAARAIRKVLSTAGFLTQDQRPDLD